MLQPIKVGKSRVNPSGNAMSQTITSSLSNKYVVNTRIDQVKDESMFTHQLARNAANITKDIIASGKLATSDPSAKSVTPVAPPQTVAEVTAKTAGYKMLEKLQLSNVPTTFTKDYIGQVMRIFGKVVNVELIVDPILKKFNVSLFRIHSIRVNVLLCIQMIWSFKEH